MFLFCILYISKKKIIFKTCGKLKNKKKNILNYHICCLLEWRGFENLGFSVVKTLETLRKCFIYFFRKTFLQNYNIFSFFFWIKEEENLVVWFFLCKQYKKAKDNKLKTQRTKKYIMSYEWMCEEENKKKSNNNKNNIKTKKNKQVLLNKT